MLSSALILSLMLSPAAEAVERDEAAIQPQPQGPQLGWGMNPGAAPPRGGTPEPTLLWLLGGGGLAYGALRRRRSNGGQAPKA
ncbi:MAG: PEP-CTERM sorting domain-containing protein [Planctomycetota bacterium]|nr:PEP-CTERM sorting domain-containing protein [Planctomycetota bacterium]